MIELTYLFQIDWFDLTTIQVDQIDNTDIPLIDDSVELIIRPPDEFITHLNLPDEPLFEDRVYSSSYIRHQRIQNWAT